jgi:hypothetical protein
VNRHSHGPVCASVVGRRSKNIESHASSPTQSATYTKPLSPLCYILSRKKVPTEAFLNGFLRGHEALHYGGSELPELLERLAPLTICIASTEVPWNRFQNIQWGERPIGSPRVAHRSVTGFSEVDLNPLAADLKTRPPATPRP